MSESTPHESDQLPEEGPAEVVPDDAGDGGESSRRKDAERSGTDPDAGRQPGDSDKATGNPDNAG
jgi:hypothetical protein